MSAKKRPEMNLSSMRDKARQRRTKNDILLLRIHLAGLIWQHRPLTIRHLFYLAVSECLIEKTEAEYNNVVIRLVTAMRED